MLKLTADKNKKETPNKSRDEYHTSNALFSLKLPLDTIRMYRQCNLNIIHVLTSFIGLVFSKRFGKPTQTCLGGGEVNENLAYSTLIFRGCGYCGNQVTSWYWLTSHSAVWLDAVVVSWDRYQVLLDLEDQDEADLDSPHLYVFPSPMRWQCWLHYLAVCPRNSLCQILLLPVRLSVSG